MFVWECIKSEGQHIGMCVDSFMFGSCCAHNLTENIVMPQTVVYKPNKPLHHHHQQHNKYKPSTSMTSHLSSSGTTTIHRPHGAGTIVIRPSQTVTQRPYMSGMNNHNNRPLSSNYGSFVQHQNSKVPIISGLSDNTIADLDASASISTGLWNAQSSSSSSAAPTTMTAAQTSQWHVTTQPNFITKPKPAGQQADKITPSWTKPKSTKKPILMVDSQNALTSTHQQQEYSSKPTTTKPKPQVAYFIICTI